ncbi:MAG: hypothetical protein JSR85_04225 [Proteobacteria bacterium]|nr:hypothetical protein [Pseudomonadota bacterium]
MYFFDLLFKTREATSALGSKILGYFFLLLATAGGGFFLFQILVPLIGYLESGITVSATFAILGAGLLFFSQEKTSPQEEAAQKAINFLNNFDLEKTLKDNALMISLLSFGVGIGLSQLKNATLISEAYKFLTEKK